MEDRNKSSVPHFLEKGYDLVKKNKELVIVGIVLFVLVVVLLCFI